MAVNPAIAMGVQPLQLTDPLTQYGRFAAIQQAQNQNALAQYQLGAAQREEASQNALNEAYKAAYDPQTGAVDMNRLRQTLSTGGFGSKLPAIEKSMADMEEQRLKRDTAKAALVDVKLKQARSFLDTIDPADPTAPEKFMAWHEANHRDPVLGPVLAARGVTADQSRGRIQQAIQQGPEAFAQLLMQSKVGTEKFMEMNKPVGYAPGTAVYKPGQTTPMFTVPKEPTVPAAVQELEAYLKMTPEQKQAFERLQKIKSPSVTATATSTTPTAKSLAGPVGARAETSLVKAEGAAGIMESANMVREALNTGNVIAGPLAGVRTKFAQVLELAGAGDKEKLVNTRTAVQGLATMTLESRAELKGQGQVTENEQKLLERARSGNIEDMTIAELQQVVNVSQRLANRLWSSHQSLLKTMETDPAAADSLRYYRPTVSLPTAIGEGRPKAEQDKRKEGLGKIFGAQPQR